LDLNRFRRRKEKENPSYHSEKGSESAWGGTSGKGGGGLPLSEVRKKREELPRAILKEKEESRTIMILTADGGEVMESGREKKREKETLARWEELHSHPRPLPIPQPKKGEGVPSIQKNLQPT